MFKSLSFLFVAATLLVAQPALADDWTAVKLHGQVFTVSPIDASQWVKLNRGDIVSDARAVRTFGSGNVEFQRGSETVAFGPNTQAAIVDREGGKPFTTVVEQMGTVAVEADVRLVQHFAVQTPYLVAVVKGTLFSVRTGRRGSDLEVQRGLVAVTGAHGHRSILVAAGQRATASPSGEVSVSGTANASLTHPVVNGVAEDTDVPSGQVLGRTIDTVGGTLGDTVGNVAGALGNTVSDLGGGLGDGLGGGLGDTVSSLTRSTTVGNTVSTVTNGVGNTVGSVTGGVGNVLGHLGL